MKNFSKKLNTSLFKMNTFKDTLKVRNYGLRLHGQPNHFSHPHLISKDECNKTHNQKKKKIYSLFL